MVAPAIFVVRSYDMFILQCTDGSYSTGATSDVDRRLNDHQVDHHPHSYTFRRRPVKLVYVDVTDDVVGIRDNNKKLGAVIQKRPAHP